MHSDKHILQTLFGGGDWHWRRVQSRFHHSTAWTLDRGFKSRSRQGCRSAFSLYCVVVLFCMGVNLGLSRWGKNMPDWGCLRTGCWGEHLDLRGRKWWQEAREDCIMRSFITCSFHQLLLGWSSQGGWDEWGILRARERSAYRIWLKNLKGRDYFSITPFTVIFHRRSKFKVVRRDESGYRQKPSSLTPWNDLDKTQIVFVTKFG
jgi:hypothetical protein